jgi:MSHA biogenesis protein MshO
MRSRILTPNRCAGFTLVEMIMVMVITGVIAGVVAIFIQKPIQGYFDSVRRAELTDAADVALRRIDRDIRSALPNSVRSGDADHFFLELLPARSGGRYRASGDGGTNPLDVTSASDSSFDILGPGVTVAAGDSIVIYNTGQAGADAYVGDNRRAFAGVPGNTVTSVTFTTPQFPRHSETYRFDVISLPVSYACEQATGTLWRYSGYAIPAAQPIAHPIAGAVRAALATNVVCQAAGNGIGTGFEVRSADGLVSLRIQLTSGGETVNLYREVHIDNAP